MSLKQSYQKLTKEAVDYLANVQLQHDNKFECLLYANSFTRSPVSAAFFTILGTALLKFYVQEVEIPRPVLEMDRVNNMTFVKDIKYPDSFSMKLLEDEKGLTIRALEYWRSSIYGKGALGGFVDSTPATSDATANNSYYPGFKSDMYAFKANLILKMIGVNDDVTALLYPSVSFKGILPMEIKPITVKQDGDSHLIYDVTFSVDDIHTNFI